MSFEWSRSLPILLYLWPSIDLQPNMSLCATCATPLEVHVDLHDSSSDDENEDVDMAGQGAHTVPDDVVLSCGDHFHWECLLDNYELDRCPKCSRDITSHPAAGSSTSAPAPQILVDLHNEGGRQSQIDIFPILQEESYLRAYPDERKCRAFLEFCREGDHRAVAELLISCDEDSQEDDDDEELGPAKSSHEILRYQDPIGDMQSGLHAAAANGHREVAWLLLLLASNYPELEFPALVFQEAAALGVMRGDQEGKPDIRSLKDGFERTAEDVARDAGVVWNGWIGNQRLSMS